MPTFLYTAKTRAGLPVAERITANNISAARYALETRGYTNIQFETDDMQASIDRTIGAKPPPDGWTPELEMESRRLGGPWSHLAFALKVHAVFWVPLVCWNIYSLWEGPPFGRWAWSGFALTLGFLGYFVFSVLPGVAFQLLLAASAWARWDELRFFVRFLRFYKRFSATPVPEFELDMRLGYALASEGKLAEALDLVRKYEQDPTIAKSIYYNRVSALYLPAGQYHKALELRALSVAQGSGSAAELIDYALVFARDCRDPAGARRVLAQLEGLEIVALAAPFLALCHGIVAVEENHWEAAKKHLLEALEKAEPFTNNVAFTGAFAQIHAYLALALGHLAERAAAAEHFRAARPYLTAHKKQALLTRCQEVVGR